MSTLPNSYGNISCVHKKPQLCCTGPQCQSNLAISLENILHPALQTPPIVSRHDNKQNSGIICQAKAPASPKVQQKY